MVLAPNAGFLLAAMPFYCRFRPIECCYPQSVSVSISQDQIRGSAITSPKLPPLRSVSNGADKVVLPPRLPRPPQRSSAQVHRHQASRLFALRPRRRERQLPLLEHKTKWTLQLCRGWRRQAPTKQVVEDLRSGSKAPTWRAGGAGLAAVGAKLGVTGTWQGGVASAHGRTRGVSPAHIYLLVTSLRLLI